MTQEKKVSFTLFTTPKALKGYNLVSFLNALGTWQRLEPAPEIIVFGEDKILDDCNVRVVREYERNKKGLPFINDLFRRAQRIASNDILMYTNDDMLFLPDLVLAIEMALSLVDGPFLATGQRWDVDIRNLLLFDDLWRESLVDTVEKTGVLHPPSGKDYFIFRKPLGFFMRCLYVGRPGWDVLLVADALDSGLPVIDLTEMVLAIHANHDYKHVPGGLHPSQTKLDEWKHNARAFRMLSRGASRTEPPNFPWVLSSNGDVEQRL